MKWQVVSILTLRVVSSRHSYRIDMHNFGGIRRTINTLHRYIIAVSYSFILLWHSVLRTVERSLSEGAC